MAKRRKRNSNKEMRSQVKAILLFALAIFCFYVLLQTHQTGGIGYVVNSILRILAGRLAVIIPVIIAVAALRIIVPPKSFNLKLRLCGLLILAVLYMTWVHIEVIAVNIPLIPDNNLLRESFMLGIRQEGGGVIGAALAVAIFYLLGITGSRILLAALALIALLFIFDISLRKLTGNIFTAAQKAFELFVRLISLLGKASSRAAISLFTVVKYSVHTVKNIIKRILSSKSKDLSTGSDDRSVGEQRSIQPVLPVESEYQKERRIDVLDPGALSIEYEEPPAITVTKQQSQVEYCLPTIDMLSLPITNNEKQPQKVSRERAKLLENTLLSFGVRAKVIHVQTGPTVTRFEVQPESGVKVSKIVNLSDDLALNMAAPLVRIEAPIPGKAALGIEVPNKVIDLVCLREVLEDQSFKESSSPLTIALGKDITGVPVVTDMSTMPHLLIAGSTGSGKSVCLNTLITSILYKAGPDRVRFLMIDPKVVELSAYNNIPHLLMPVLTEPRKAALALKNMVKEMGKRYSLFARLGVRDIAAYNQMAGEEGFEQLSYVVVVIDELADLMLVSPGDVEDAIARLAQMSRAAGIHLIIATQRPSVDVLTGIIKANITSRIAFTVSSQFDSRTILDMGGAEKLLGRGDMLYYPVGAVKPMRLQGAYISELDIRKVTDFLREQGYNGYNYEDIFMDVPDEDQNEDLDSLFKEAVELVVRTGQGSISLLQRRFRIGYTRAARLIDDLERRGIVGKFEGSKPREILVTEEQAARICDEIDLSDN